MVVGTAGAASFSIPNYFWDTLAQLVAPSFSDKLSYALPEQERPEITVGIAGDTFTHRRLAQVIITTSTESNPDTASTTLDQGALLNPTLANGGKNRRITRLEFYSASTTKTFLGGPLIMDFNTSTQYASSSLPIFSSTLTTSTLPLSIATSTPNGASPGVWQMLWQPGEYLHCTTNRAISTTYAYCLAEYVDAQ